MKFGNSLPSEVFNTDFLPFMSCTYLMVSYSTHFNHANSVADYKWKCNRNIAGPVTIVKTKISYGSCQINDISKAI